LSAGFALKARLRHAHHLFRNPVRLLFLDVIRLPNPEFRHDDSAFAKSLKSLIAICAVQLAARMGLIPVLYACRLLIL